MNQQGANERVTGGVVRNLVANLQAQGCPAQRLRDILYGFQQAAEFSGILDPSGREQLELEGAMLLGLPTVELPEDHVDLFRAKLSEDGVIITVPPDLPPELATIFSEKGEQQVEKFRYY